MTNALEVMVSERFVSVMGNPLIAAVFILAVFLVWMMVSKMDRVGIIFISMLIIGTLTKIGFIPPGIWLIAVFGGMLIFAISFFRGTGES